MVDRWPPRCSQRFPIFVFPAYLPSPGPSAAALLAAMLVGLRSSGPSDGPAGPERQPTMAARGRSCRPGSGGRRLAVIVLNAGLIPSSRPPSRSAPVRRDARSSLFAVRSGLMTGRALGTARRPGWQRAAVLILARGNFVSASDSRPCPRPAELMRIVRLGASGGIRIFATNAQGVRVEAAYGRPLMTSMPPSTALAPSSARWPVGAFVLGRRRPCSLAAVIDVAGVVIDGTCWLLASTRCRAHAAAGAGAGAGAAPKSPFAPRASSIGPMVPGQHRLSPGPRMPVRETHRLPLRSLAPHSISWNLLA